MSSASAPRRDSELRIWIADCSTSRRNP